MNSDIPAASSAVESLLNNWLVRMYQADTHSKATALYCLLKGHLNRALASRQVDQARHDEVIREAEGILNDKQAVS